MNPAFADAGSHEPILSTNDRDNLLEYALRARKLDTPDRDNLLEDFELARYGDRDARSRLCIWFDDHIDALEGIRING